MSLRRRLVLTLFILVIIGFFGVTRWVRGEFRNSYAQVVEDILSDYAHLLAAELENSRMSLQSFETLKQKFSKYGQHEFKSQIFDFIKTKSSLAFYVTDDKGIVVSSAKPEELGKDFSKWNDVYKTLRGEYGARATRLDKNDSRTSVYFVAAPIIIDSKIAGVATVYKTEGSILAFLDNALEKIFLGGLFSVAGIIVFGGLIMIWISLPLERLRNYALDISEGKRAILPRSNIREVKQLSEAFEKMRISLQGKKTVERYTQTLTHELKSPLTAIKGAAELSLEIMADSQGKHFLKNIIDESNRSHLLLEQLLKIAALESSSGLEQTAQVDLLEVANEAKEALLGLWRPKKIVIDINSSENVTLQGDRFLLFQSFRNILQNAIEFSKADSKIKINIQKIENGVNVTIDDEGTGIPTYALERIFEKFYSLERPDSKKSSGLGLSFVKEVVQLHQGDIEVESPYAGHTGTRVKISFHGKS